MAECCPRCNFNNYLCNFLLFIYEIAFNYCLEGGLSPQHNGKVLCHNYSQRKLIYRNNKYLIIHDMQRNEKKRTRLCSLRLLCTEKYLFFAVICKHYMFLLNAVLMNDASESKCLSAVFTFCFA